MRRLLVLLCAVLLLAPLSAFAQTANTATCAGFGDIQLKPMGFESITVSTVSVGFTAGTINPASGKGAIMAVVLVEAQPIRYRDDGTAPTSGVGVPVVAGVQILVCGVEAVRAVRFIRSGGVDATLSVSYYSRR